MKRLLCAAALALPLAANAAPGKPHAPVSARTSPLGDAEVAKLKDRLPKDCRLQRSQTVHVSLSNLKNAIFAVCHDLHMLFVQDGFVVGEVPGTDVPWPDRIDAIAFKDVNGDDREDLLMLYTVTSGARATAVTRRAGAVLVNTGPGNFKHEKMAEAALPEAHLSIDTIEKAARKALAPAPPKPAPAPAPSPAQE